MNENLTHRSDFVNDEPDINPEPNRSSVVFNGNQEDLRKIDVNTYEDAYGRLFVKPDGHEFRYAEDRILLKRILRGIVPVSDMVYIKNLKGEGSFFRYIHQSITSRKDLYLSHHGYGRDEEYSKERSETKPSREFLADILILKDIFMDYDHELQRNSLAKDKDHLFYDLEMFGGHFWYPDPIMGYRGRENNIYPIFSPENLKYKMDEMDDSTVEYVKIRILSLFERLEGDNGLNFIEAIITQMMNTGMKLPRVVNIANGETVKEKVAFFHEELSKRVRICYKLVCERL